MEEGSRVCKDYYMHLDSCSLLWPKNGVVEWMCFTSFICCESHFSLGKLSHNALKQCLVQHTRSNSKATFRLGIWCSTGVFSRCSPDAGPDGASWGRPRTVHKMPVQTGMFCVWSRAVPKSGKRTLKRTLLFLRTFCLDCTQITSSPVLMGRSDLDMLPPVHVANNAVDSWDWLQCLDAHKRCS